jgi:SAM-dependent methyltransferase
MFSEPHAYWRFMGRWSRLVAPLLVEFSGIADGGKYLDVGSGIGALSFALAERMPLGSVTGIDRSAEYVAHAGSNNPFPGRVRFQTGDVQRLAFAEASFDAALSLLVFNFIPDAAVALHELRRVTRKGGQVAAAVWDYSDGMGMLRTFWDAAARIDGTVAQSDEKHMRLCRQGELGELWRAAGLRDVEERALDIATSFSCFEDYWEPFLLGQGPAGTLVKNLAPASVVALKDELRKRLTPADSAQPFTLPARAWAVRGTA